MPKVASLAELNELLAAADDLDNARHLPGRQDDIGTAFTAEQPALSPLPMEAFETGLTLTPRVDRHARITVRCCHYSVPASLVGRRVRVLLRASSLVVFDGRREVARHERSARKWSTTLVLDHYLEVLLKKPGALPGATALVQARRSGVFTAEHEAFWAAARTALGDTAGTRELVEVLLLHRRQAHGEVIAGIAAALVVGAVRADVVAVEVRRLAQARPRTIAEPPSPSRDTARVVSLTQRRLSDPDATFAALPPDRRPPPSVAAYDELLPRRAAATSTQPGAAASPASSEVS